MVSSQLTLVRIKSLLKHAALTDPRVLPGGCGHFLSLPFPLLNLGASSLLDTMLGTEVVMEMLEVKFPRQEVFKEGAESLAALPPSLFPAAGIQWPPPLTSPHHSSVTLPISPLPSRARQSSSSSLSV